MFLFRLPILCWVLSVLGAAVPVLWDVLQQLRCLMHAASDEAGSGINYIINDIDALKIGIAEVYGSGWTQAQLDSVLGTLDIIDSNNDNRIGTSEVKTAVQDAFGVIAGPLSIGQVAIAFDAMNNMPSLEKEFF